MGNEQSNQSKPKERSMSVKNPVRYGNGSARRLSLPNGGINVKDEPVIQQNGVPSSLPVSPETTDYVILESDSKPASDLPKVASQVLETATKTEEVVHQKTDEALEKLSKLKDEALETVNQKKEEVQETINKTEEVLEATIKAEVKKSKEKINLFSKMFKKKTEDPTPPPAVVEILQEEVNPNEDQTDHKAPEESPPAAKPEPETVNVEASPEPKPESQPAAESTTPDPSPEEEKAPEPEAENGQKENIPEENTVMNFFKTLVTPTKTAKKETAAPAAAKEQESQPAETTTVAQVSEPPAAPKGMSIPPPPPPEPPKMEIKAEPAAKPAKSSPKVEPKAAAKEPEPAKGKSAKDTLSKFFRPKTIKTPSEPTVEVDGQAGIGQETSAESPEPVVEVQSQSVVEPPEAAAESAQLAVEEQVAADVKIPELETEVQKVDPSKAGTLEAAAKPEPPPPVQEEKKAAPKSAFLSMFKPKAADPKKATPAPPAAAAEAAQTVKEEPKAAAKAPEAAVENKPASGAPPAGDEAASVPRLEKRNSIHKFFRNLGQKRGSTDAGVQTEAAVAAAAEKAK